MNARSGFLKRLGVAALAAGEAPTGVLDVQRAHEPLADEDRVDPHALEVVELLAAVEARLRDDRLARRDVAEQLVRALDVDGEVAEVAVVDADDVGVHDLQSPLELLLVVNLDEDVEVEPDGLAVQEAQGVVVEGGDDEQD